ncbi:membrane hypothetical protein [Bacillus sp. 349Y]|nr:membrane hypothetical protein [Bacillus sp. 349Y]
MLGLYTKQLKQINVKLITLSIFLGVLGGITAIYFPMVTIGVVVGVIASIIYLKKVEFWTTTLISVFLFLKFPIVWIFKSDSISLVASNISMVLMGLTVVTLLVRRKIKKNEEMAHLWFLLSLLLFYSLGLIVYYVILSKTTHLIVQLAGLYYLMYFVVPFIFSYVFVNRKRFELILKLIVWFGLINSVLSIIQATTMGGYLQYIPEYSTEVPNSLYTRIGGLLTVRSIGLFNDPNLLGGFLVIFLLTILWTNTKRNIITNFVLFPLGFLGLLFTYSRSSMIAFVIGLLVFVFIRKMYKTILLGISVAILFSAVAFEKILSFMSLSNGSAEYHKEDLIIGFLGLFEHPFGIGIGHAGILATSSWVSNVTSNLSLGSETGFFAISLQIGIIGSVLFFSFHACVLFKLRKMYQKAQENRFIGLGISLMVSFLTLHLFLPVYNQATTVCLVMIISGYLVKSNSPLSATSKV